ncbi:hypothetical protein V6N13_033558 [Hibiscus sabdariffa]
MGELSLGFVNLDFKLQGPLKVRRNSETQWSDPNLSGSQGAKLSYCDVVLNKSGPVLKRVKGFVEDESLKKLSKCLIGTMLSVCSISKVEDLLSNWGFGDIGVKSLGGGRFLLEIMDQDLYNMLKDLDWSYLKEIFTEIEPWSEKFQLPERITWLKVSGIPLHCWNQETFSSISDDVWGKLLSLGENAFQSKNASEINILISTNKMERIYDSIILEVENECFMIHVVDHACSPKNVFARKSNPTLSEFSSESSTKSCRRTNQSIGSVKTVVMDGE